jgi:hypothetical protein
MFEVRGFFRRENLRNLRNLWIGYKVAFRPNLRNLGMS